MYQRTIKPAVCNINNPRIINLKTVTETFTTLRLSLNIWAINKINNKLPSNDFVNEYIQFLKPYAHQLKGIHLYSMVRPSQQKTDLQIEALDKGELQIIADKMNVLKTKLECY